MKLPGFKTLKHVLRIQSVKNLIPAYFIYIYISQPTLYIYIYLQPTLNTAYIGESLMVQCRLIELQGNQNMDNLILQHKMK